MTPPPDTAPAPRTHAALVWAMALVTIVVISPVALFISFLFAYGFRDTPGWGSHVFFLVAVAIVAATESMIVALLVRAIDRSLDPRQAQRFGLFTTYGLTLIALGLGTWISLLHEDENSVTADQANAPFVAIVVLGIVGGVISLGAATRVLRDRSR